MKLERERELIDKYSNLFEPEEIRRDETKSCMAWGFEIGNGWSTILEDMLEQVSEVVKRKQLKDFYFVQIKEKFGCLRVYTSLHDDEISEIIQNYEELSGEICEICGEPGVLRKGGWIKCLCDKHVKK